MRFVTPTYSANLESFTRLHLSEHGLSEQHKEKGVELRVRCPFCDGGDHKEFSFDVNIDRGVARCWRATCGWRGTGHKLYAEVLGISRREGWEALSGGDSEEQVVNDFDAFDKLWMSQLFRTPDVSALDFDEHVPGSKPLMDADDEIIEEIREWIEGRGYNFFDFIKTHRLIVPPQFQKWEGYVLFEYDTNGNTTYQGYKFAKDLQGLDVRPGTTYRIPKTMAGSHNIKQSLYRYDELKPRAAVMLTEGIFDAARLLSYGFQATCSFSTGLADYQAYLLAQLKPKEIIVFYDYNTEKESQRAANTIKKYCDPNTTKISIVTLTKRDADPDELTEREVTYFLSKRKEVSNGFTNSKIIEEFSRLIPEV